MAPPSEREARHAAAALVARLERERALEAERRAEADAVEAAERRAAHAAAASTAACVMAPGVDALRPLSLQSLCVGFLGANLEDALEQVPDALPVLPPEAKAALLAVARRRRLLSDGVLALLADGALTCLDVSGGAELTAAGVAAAAAELLGVREADVSGCDALGRAGLLAVCRAAPRLHTLRVGGSAAADAAVRDALPDLLPRLAETSTESWEESLEGDIVEGAAPDLRTIFWPGADRKSVALAARLAPRVVVVPQRAPRALDAAFAAGVDAKAWELGASTRRRRACFRKGAAERPVLHIAERFRLAYVSRNLRLAPKRAKNVRQKERRDVRAASADRRAVEGAVPSHIRRYVADVELEL